MQENNYLSSSDGYLNEDDARSYLDDTFDKMSEQMAADGWETIYNRDTIVVEKRMDEDGLPVVRRSFSVENSVEDVTNYLANYKNYRS